MIQDFSLNTKAILLLTAPLIYGSSAASPDVLTPGEYKRLARHLREIQRQPEALLSPDGEEIIHSCQSIVDESRLERLIGRGFLLSQVIERWHARSIWVVSRADDSYPRLLKSRLQEDSPAIIYGCGEIDILMNGGLAVVGSRNADKTLIDYTKNVGSIAALAGKTIISGGAKGIDQAAMSGALETGGYAVGVLADGLEKACMNREYRSFIMDGKLTLISPYDPNAGFNVGNAMQRNKLIYALADAALVVSSEVNKGGTWAGAVEQLKKHKSIPVFVPISGKQSIGIQALMKEGALPWPEPRNANDFDLVFNTNFQVLHSRKEPELPLFPEIDKFISSSKTTKLNVDAFEEENTGGEDEK